jgi:hypothetical protein
LDTVTVAEPIAETSAAAIAAVSCVELTKVVVRVAWFQSTVELPLKRLPKTPSVKSPLPTMAPAGDKELIVGGGFLIIIGVGKGRGSWIPGLLLSGFLSSGTGRLLRVC